MVDISVEIRFGVTGLAIGIGLVIVSFFVFSIAIPIGDVIVCESSSNDSSYGEASVDWFPPAIECDFSADPFFPEQGLERRFTGVILAASTMAVALMGSAGYLFGRRRSRSSAQTPGGVNASDLTGLE